jgi:hypothetical protein
VQEAGSGKRTQAPVVRGVQEREGGIEVTPEQERRREVAALQWIVKALDCLDEAAGDLGHHSGIYAERASMNLAIEAQSKIRYAIDRWNNSGDPDCRPITMEEIEGR